MADSRKEREEEEVAEKQATSAYVIYRAISDSAKEELERTALSLAFSGLAAGLAMGFSAVAEAILAARLGGSEDWRLLVTKLGYCVGFLIVIIGRQQLFTENTLTPVLPLLHHRDVRTTLKVLRLWSIVLVTNLIGTALFALAIAHWPVLDASVKSHLLTTSQHTVDAAFQVIFVRAIFAGWLIALMVWLLPGAETGRIPIIVVMTYLIGIAGFSHVIAGSTEAFFLAASHKMKWSAAIDHFILPALLGNILGGTALVAALNYGQAAPNDEEEGASKA